MGKKKKSDIPKNVIIDQRELPKHIVFAIKFEEKCIKYRKKQITNYKKRIILMQKGVCYFDTFKKIKATKGLGFPTKVYTDLNQKWKDAQKKEKKGK